QSQTTSNTIMKTRKTSNRLLVAMMVIACCCQQISAGSTGKAGKTKNSTVIAKELTATTKHPKVMHKVKMTSSTTTTTTTTSTTEKPDLEMTTLPNLDMDLDGRSAYINNQYVADTELNVHDTSSPLYELLHKQMETVLANKGDDKLELYRVNSPQMKESLDELTQKPLFAYDVAQFDDYDEEEEDTSEEYMPDNCEDTQESLKDNDSSGNQQNLLNNYGQSLGDSSQPNLKPNKPYDSSNYGPQTALVTSSTYNSGQNAYIHKKPNNKATQKPQAAKTKPSSYQQSPQQNAYGQAKPSEQYIQKDQETTEQNSNKQQQLQTINQKPQQNSYNTPKPSSTKPLTQHSKPKPVYTTLNQKLQTSNFQNSAANNNQNFTNLQPTNSYVSRLPSLITSSPVNPTLASNFLYGSSNTPALSPFSSTSTSTSTASASAQQKRHLTFRTVASSTQYVSSPLADLMFKFSIGMAKPANSANSVTSFGDNPAQIYNLINDQ
ncbi:hypothetical protein DOY81_005333, partial [Sarcophaga bullata]